MIILSAFEILMRSLFMLLFCDLHSRHKHDFIFLLLRLLRLWKLTPSSQIKVRAPSHTRGCCMGISLSPVHKHGDFCSSQKRKTKQKVARRVRYSLFLKCIFLYVCAMETLVQERGSTSSMLLPWERRRRVFVQKKFATPPHTRFEAVGKKCKAI